MKTPREIAEDVLEREPWALALWDREAAIALVVEAVEQSRREVAELTQEGTSFQPGDRVRLTGRNWGRDRDKIVTVKHVDAYGDPCFHLDGFVNSIFIITDRLYTYDYSATKVED